MDKIISCDWKDKEPAFYKDVYDDTGVKIAKIHALTKLDYAEIEREAGTKYIIRKDETYMQVNGVKMQLLKIYKSLQGHGCGWAFDRPVTIENISVLPEKYYNAIKNAIDELEKQNTITEGIRKN